MSIAKRSSISVVSRHVPSERRILAIALIRSPLLSEHLLLEEATAQRQSEKKRW